MKMAKKFNYRQDWDKEKIDYLKMEIRNFILFYTSDDKERKEMEEVLDIYVKEDLEDRYLERENWAVCLECGKDFKQERDLQICDKCVDKFDLNRLWKEHDNNELDALDFNESKKMRERFRVR